MPDYNFDEKRRQLIMGASVFSFGSLSYEQGKATSFNQRCDSILSFGAVGDGEVDDTFSIQNALNSCSCLFFPPGYVFKCSDSLCVSLENSLICGGGELRFTSAILNKKGIRVLAPGFKIDGICLTNHSHVGEKLGPKTVGVYIESNCAVVNNCTIDGWQNGIQVSPFGEFSDFRITNNKIVNIIGAGDGPDNQSSTLGEDRGDGISVWGSSAIIAGNFVDSLESTDARCGIFVEALDSLHPHSYLCADSRFIIENNIVRGRFRRSIDAEGVASVIVSSNICAAGSWGGIQISAATKQAVVKGNVVEYYRAHNDLTGQAWGPWRCGIVVYGDARDIIVANNIVNIHGAGDGIYVYGTTKGRSSNALIDGNLVVYTKTPSGVGIKVQYSDYPLVQANQLVACGALGSGFSAGLQFVDVVEPVIKGNSIEMGCKESAGAAIFMEENTTGALVVNNRIISALVVFYCTQKKYVSFQGNRLIRCTLGGDMFGCESSIVSGNLFGGAQPIKNISNGVAGCLVHNNLA